MKHHAPDEALAKLVTKPGEMAGVGCSGRRVRLDLDGDDLGCRDLREDVDLVAPLLLAKVVKARAAGGLLAAIGARKGNGPGGKPPGPFMSIAWPPGGGPAAVAPQARLELATR